MTRWDPPEAVAFTWHPGDTPEKATQVEVTFTSAAEAQTLVVLEHSGWEVFADAAAARSEYEKGWALTLELYRENVDGRAKADTWVALLHSPGPAAPSGEALFDAPRIGEHFAFLSRMQEAGYLVAAGPLTDAPGAGMTVLRLPGSDRLGEATHLATEDDTSVASGLLQVSVRPWQVMLQA